MEAHIDRDRDRRFWDTYWSGGHTTVGARTMTQVLDRIKLEYLRAILPGGGHTLEVGSGSGRLSCWLAQEGYGTMCLDYSRNALESARANYASAKAPGQFVVGDGVGLPVQDESVDVVLSTGLLEHFPDPAPIVHEMVRVLKPGGLFYSDIVPKKFSLFRSLDWVGQLKRTLWSNGAATAAFYERGFTSREIYNLLAACGLRQVRVFPAGVVPPYLPLLSRSDRLREAQVALVERTQRLWKAMDRTLLAEWLGFYYFAWATKPR
ncbi:MAG: class I SAM-dependent methyltransferase [Nitrospiraceae bacterium]